MTGHAPATPFKVSAATALVLVLLVASGITGVHLLAGRSDRGTPHDASPATTPASTLAVPNTTTLLPTGIPAPDLDAEVARLRAAPTPRAQEAVSAPVSKDATAHPDLYAAELVRRLLTQDYRTPRDDMLAWVQAESAQTSEPLIVGLVPRELRPKWAVFSVSDTVEGPAPVPGVDEWATLAASGTSTTARVLRVTEPLAWTNAVEAGRITDPGVTARVVSAEVTRHTQARVEIYSVEISLELEGPPARDDWGFVGAVTYTVVPMGQR